ncbi:glutamate--tRNA ligase [Candidatus Micrarchaeota archaeon]|nr:glutamate--tRNA ligase [Candidatus Micrarchaeota archaeon]MBD3417377.1 glutamate--tRNA ligase [Candidatus Micrarchaeota archaeon]
MLTDIIRKYALKNRKDFGNARPQSIVGKVVAEFPDAKKDMKTTMQEAARICEEVNVLPEPDLDAELSKYSFEEKKHEEKELALQNAEQGKVVTRFPPEPSGYPHIGHAKASFLDYELAKKYGGKMLLRFDDTNPEKEKPEYVDAIKEGLEWLGVEWDGEETYTSDNMEKFYSYAGKMLEMDKAYVCTCTTEQISKNRELQAECECRKLPLEEQKSRWKKMLDGGYGAGEAILRYKGDLSSENTAMRDPTLFRIILFAHYRQGEQFRAWPSYDFAAPIMDSIEGVTHALRTKEYELRNPLYFAVLKDLKLREPKLVEFARLSIKNTKVGKRYIRPLVKEGKVEGWDDPRLPTLKGLKRRGILPQAIKSFVLSFGLTKTESEPVWDKLLSENRKLLDPVASHYFFVPNPIRIKVEGAPERTAKMKIHPEKEEVRQYSVKDTFYVPRAEIEGVKEGEVFRLKELYNVRMIENMDEVKVGYAGEEITKDKKLQWVSEPLECEIWKAGDLFINDGYNSKSLIKERGYCEKAVLGLDVGTIVQFERYGFCRLDSKEPLRFIYSC